MPRRVSPTAMPHASGHTGATQFVPADSSGARFSPRRLTSTKKARDQRTRLALRRAQRQASAAFNSAQDALLPADALAPFTGHWVAVREGVVVADRVDGDELVALPEVRPTDLITWVAPRRT